MLNIVNATKSYDGKKRAIDQVSFQLKPGDLLGLIIALMILLIFFFFWMNVFFPRFDFQQDVEVVKQSIAALVAVFGASYFSLRHSMRQHACGRLQVSL